MTDQTRIPLKHPHKPSPPPGGWPTGGTEVAGWHLCTPCGDSIYPGEHVYDNGDGTVRCAVCEIKHRAGAPRRVPTMAERVGCGHTPEQHRHTDGQAADAASHDRAMRELETELKWSRDAIQRCWGIVKGVAAERNKLIEAMGRMISLPPEAIATAYEVSYSGGNPEAEAPLGSVSPRAQDDRNALVYNAVSRALLDCDPWAPLATLRERCTAAVLAALADQPTALPAWVLELIRGLDRYELEHPSLYRQNGDGTYGRWPCPEPLLALVPTEVLRQAEVGDREPHESDQALRDRLEHAIRARIGEAWPSNGDTEHAQWLDRVAAVAATAAVGELRQG